MWFGLCKGCGCCLQPHVFFLQLIKIALSLGTLTNLSRMHPVRTPLCPC